MIVLGFLLKNIVNVVKRQIPKEAVTLVGPFCISVLLLDGLMYLERWRDDYIKRKMNYLTDASRW